MPGAMHRGRFDDWYPGFVDHVNNFRNTVSFLTETALYRYATPHFYTTDDFPRDKQDLRSRGLLFEPVEAADGGGWATPCATRWARRWRCSIRRPRIARSCCTTATARAAT